MKGIVFNLLEEAVTAELGADTWDALLDSCKLDGAYTSLGTYPDEQLYAIVAAASAALGKPADEIVRWFGDKAAVAFAKRYPTFFTGHRNTRSFLLTLNDIIHPEVRKLYPGAGVPSFTFNNLPGGGLSMEYKSPRQLCAFAEGLITGSAGHFGEQAHVEHAACERRGDRSCVLNVTFTKAE